MSSTEFKRAVRRYAAERGVSYTTALRAITAQRFTEDAGVTGHPGPRVLISPGTGCWRSWTGPADFAAPLHNSLRDPRQQDHLIASEPFHDDGTLELLHGDAAAQRLRQLGAPTGSKHHSDQACLVCHADVQYATPAGVDEVEHRCHQIRAAFERFALVKPGQGATVTCGARRGDGDTHLEAFIALTDAVRAPVWLNDGAMLRAPSRLVGFAWSSDDGWTGLLDPIDSTGPQQRLRMVDIYLSWGVWQPERIAATINNTRLEYPAAVSDEDRLVAELTARGRAVRDELDYLRGDADDPGVQVSVRPAPRAGLHFAQPGEPLVELTMTGEIWRVQWAASAGWAAVVHVRGMDDLAPARLDLARDEWRPDIVATAILELDRTLNR